MNIIVILVTGLIGVNGFKLNAATVDDNEDHVYIIGGTDAKPGDAPWQISLELEDEGPICGGSLINARHVLTAAHCCNGKPIDQLTVKFGGLDITALENNISVSKAIINPDYSPEKGNNDYCVLKLAENAVESDQVKFIKIAEKTPASGTPCKLTGWGNTQGRETSIPHQLQIAELNILDSEECDQTWMKADPKSRSITKNMICAVAKNSSSCYGDSGGPLVVDNELVGIVSWGKKGCPADTTVTPTVYADPTESKAREWIRENTE